MLKDLFRSIWCTPLKSCWKIYLRSKYGNGGLCSNMAFCSSCRKVKNCCFSLVLDQHTCGNWIITPEYGQWERRETSTKRVAKKIQVWAELLMSGICEDTLQCINYPKMTFKYSSKLTWKNKMFFHVWKSKANQTEVWIQRSFEYLIKRNNWVKMPFFKSKRVNFPLIIYCWNRAWHLWSHGSKHLFSGRPIHCCWPDSSARAVLQVGINLPTHHDSFWCAPGP